MKSRLSSALRSSGVIGLADKLRFVLYRIWFFRKNQEFLRKHRELKLPPAYLVYESYRLDYEAYYQDGLNSAKELMDELGAFIELDALNILDWGCGPARIVRHLPNLIKGTNKIFATDYNKQTIDWCRDHIPGVAFSANSITPPLNYTDSFFDFIYGISIFTHLSGENHVLWMDELHRVTKPYGLLLITTQGNAFTGILTEKEREQFRQGQLVERTKVEEGHRMFSAFQPPSFMHSLVAGKWKVRKFSEGRLQAWGPEQDSWVLQKVG